MKKSSRELVGNLSASSNIKGIAAFGLGKNLSIPVHESDALDLYKILNSPVKQVVKPTRLSPQYLSNLSLKFEQIDTNSQLSKRNLALESELSTPTLNNITELIHLNAKAKRPEQAQQAFDILLQLDIVPDLVCWNNLLHAHASTHNIEKIEKIFSQILLSHKADIVTHSILINELVHAGKIDRAFKAYDNMKGKGIKPNQIVLSTLIRGCLSTKQIDRAWQTFNFLREIETPDTQTLSMMIKACSLTQDAEKALDLFHEMADRGLAVNHRTYNALINACGSRPDYYNDAFELLEQMINQGFECDNETYRTLFQIIAANGDLERAKIVWNDIAQKVTSLSGDQSDEYNDGDKETKIKITSNIMLSMLKLYKNVLMNGPKLCSLPKTDELKSEGNLDFVEINSQAPFQVEDIKRSSLVPILISSIDGRCDYIKEADTIWKFTESLVKAETFAMTDSLLQSRLATLCEYKSIGSFDRALEFFDTEFSKYQLGHRGYSFKPLLRCAMASPETFDKGISMWNRFIEWDQTLESKLVQECEVNSMSIGEKEVKRGIDGRSARLMLDCFLIVARGYCRNHDLVKSISLLEEARKFRFPFYLPPIKLNDVQNVLAQAQRQVDLGDLTFLQRLQEICPPVHQNHLFEAQQVMKRRHISPTWWGWEAMGIDSAEREKMVRKQQLGVRQSQSLIANRKFKSSTHKENRDSKIVVMKGFA